jgi:hypothetical protein
LVFTITSLRIFPETTDPLFVTELATITVMYCEIVAGGPELPPGLLVHVPPQVAGVVLTALANPLKLDGAPPTLREFDFAHWAPQNVTWSPTAALLSPMTKLTAGAVITKFADPELPV